MSSLDGSLRLIIAISLDALPLILAIGRIGKQFYRQFAASAARCAAEADSIRLIHRYWQAGEQKSSGLAVKYRANIAV
jgi:hypothetical protein